MGPRADRGAIKDRGSTTIVLPSDMPWQAMLTPAGTHHPHRPVRPRPEHATTAVKPPTTTSPLPPCVRSKPHVTAVPGPRAELRCARRRRLRRLAPLCRSLRRLSSPAFAKVPRAPSPLLAAKHPPTPDPDRRAAKRHATKAILTPAGTLSIPPVVICVAAPITSRRQNGCLIIILRQLSTSVGKQESLSCWPLPGK